MSRHQSHRDLQNRLVIKVDLFENFIQYFGKPKPAFEQLFFQS
jgi:hypothetical protein